MNVQEQAANSVKGMKVTVRWDLNTEGDFTQTGTVTEVVMRLSGPAVKVDLGLATTKPMCDSRGIYEVHLPAGEIVLSLDADPMGGRRIGPSLDAGDQHALIVKLESAMTDKFVTAQR